MADTSSTNPNPNPKKSTQYDDNQMMKPYEFLLNRFPRGYKFVPSDQELILHYLTNRLLNIPLPTNKILDLNLYNFTPMQLTEMHKFREEEKMYFFSPRDKKYPNGKLPSRTTGGGNGFWKATGKDKEIFNERKQLIGSRKTLVFYEGKPKHGEKKTDWIMQEYKLQESLAPTSSTTRAPDDNSLDDLVLCKVYPSKMSKPNPNTLHGKKTEMSDSVPLEQDLPVLQISAVTPNLGEHVNVSNESVQALDTELMITMPFGSTAGFISQQVTNLGARSHAHHQQNLSLLPSYSQLPVIDSVSAAISSLAGADNNTGTMIATPYDGSNRSEEVINLDKNLHVENYQQDLPSLQNSSNPAVINSVASAIANLASGPVFPDMALQQVPRSFGAQYDTNETPRNEIQAYQQSFQSPHGMGPDHQSQPSLDNGCLPPLPQCYYYYDDRDYGSF